MDDESRIFDHQHFLYDNHTSRTVAKKWKNYWQNLSRETDSNGLIKKRIEALKAKERRSLRTEEQRTREREQNRIRNIRYRERRRMMRIEEDVKRQDEFGRPLFGFP